MNRFFNPNSLLWRGFGRIADFFILSCCWLLCCIPVLTFLPACIALYDSVAHGLVMGENDIYPRFFRTFRSELKRGIGLSALWLGIAGILVLVYWLVAQYAPPGIKDVACGSYWVFALFPISVLTWLIPIESRFVYSFADLHKTGLAFVFAHLPITILLLGIFIAHIVALICLPYLVMITPAIQVFLQGAIIEHVFRKCTQDDSAS